MSGSDFVSANKRKQDFISRWSIKIHNMSNAPIVPYNISSILEDNAAVLCYTIFNSLIRSCSYITLYKGLANVTLALRKCCKVYLVCEMLDASYILTFFLLFFLLTSLLLSREAGSHLIEKKETWWGCLALKEYFRHPNVCVPCEKPALWRKLFSCACEKYLWWYPIILLPDELLAYLPRLKYPVAPSVFIHLIPPPKAHQQSARYILRKIKGFNL